MYLRTLALLTLSAFSILSARAESYPFKEPFRQSGAFRADGVLSLDNINGDVEIRAWDKNEIQIEGEKSAKTEEELKLIDLQMTVSDSKAAIKVTLPKRTGGVFGNDNTIRATVKFTIRVPASVAVEQVNLVNGRLTLTGIHGAVDGHSVNGRIEASGLAANTRLKTVNGQISASFVKTVSGQRIRLETVNGEIAVKLPDNAGAALKASVLNGHITTDFPLGDDSKVRARTVKGTIGDGRASLEISSVNGQVKINRS